MRIRHYMIAFFSCQLSHRDIELIIKLMEESHHLMLCGVSLHLIHYVLQRKLCTLCTLKEFIKYGVPDISYLWYFLFWQGNIEFILNIDQFKFAGGEGNTQFGSDIIDSSTYPPLQHRLKELWRQKQLMKMLHCDSHTSRFLEIEKILLEDHESVFIPEVTEKLLADIPGEWITVSFIH